MERNEAAEDRGKDDRPNPFERFVDARQPGGEPGSVLRRDRRGPRPLGAQQAAVGAAPRSGSWRLHTGSAILSLLLLVLLENAGRRSEEAAQEKLNVIAEALSDLMTHHARDSADLQESVEKLREAVGLEERH